jgi:hypothetical protein
MDHRIRYRLRPEQCGEVSRLNAALDRIESLPVVSGHVVFQTEHNKGAGRVHVNLWCRGEHPKKADKQPYVDLNGKALGDPKAVPNYQVAAERLFAIIETEHSGCIEPAQAAMATAQGARDVGTSGIRPEPEVDQFQAMMRMEGARMRAAAANEAALAAQKEAEALEAEVEELKRTLEPTGHVRPPKS